MHTLVPRSRLEVLHQVTQACTSLPSPSISSSRLRLILLRSQHRMQPEQAQPQQWGMAPCHLPTLAKVTEVLQWPMGWQMGEVGLNQGQLQQLDQLLHNLPMVLSQLLARQQMLGPRMATLQKRAAGWVLGKLLLPGRTQLLSLGTSKRLGMEPWGVASAAGACLRRPPQTRGCPRVSCTARHPAQLPKVSSVWPSNVLRYEMRHFILYNHGTIICDYRKGASMRRGHTHAFNCLRGLVRFKQ